MSLGAPNMSSTIARYATPHTRRRYDTTTKNADGYFVANATDTSIRAYIHDADAKTVAARPEGLEGTRTIMGYSNDEIRVGQDVGQVKADSVIVDGEEFRVYKATKWNSGPAAATVWYQFTAAGPVP